MALEEFAAQLEQRAVAMEIRAAELEDVAIVSGPMQDEDYFLEKAAQYRRLAKDIDSNDRLRIVLLNMASEFVDKARKIVATGVKLPARAK